ncbi:uncharacterized protein [Henckelia pumila]|uniref:uncharacterized protein n=1 Tax=Henckelia pumila TaxID=405737 RepID=UPI003C6DF31C
MGKSGLPHEPPSGDDDGGGGANFASSCVVAAIVVIFLAVAAFTVYFTIFRPKHPTLTVNAVLVPAFSAANSTANLTFSQYVTVHNPNRAVFTHYGGSVQLLYAGNQVGYLFIPAGEIEAGGTQYMAATFAIKSIPLSVHEPPESMVPSAADGLNGFGSGFGSRMEVETRTEVAGRVRVLHLFTHHVEARGECRVAIAATDGSVLGFHC